MAQLTRQSVRQLWNLPLPIPHTDAKFHKCDVSYAEKRVVGFSAAQMFAIVNNVERYTDFVHHCKQARRLKGGQRAAEFELSIGFPVSRYPPITINEHYTSRVTWLQPSVVHARCTDGNLFNLLDTTWRFGPNPQHPSDNRSCTIHFSLEFEFKNRAYALISQMFFGSVVKNMVKDFLNRAQELYGPPVPVDPKFSAPQILSYRNHDCA